ncbi:MAG: hybrid sensor histidine kinase/response regulator [Chloroflexi bacterium]|nr:hybrid sensor histidine kinase/response regulator [Chloroflexota bacterium]
MLRAIWNPERVDENSRANLEELRQQLMSRLATWVAIIGGIFTWLLLPAYPFPPSLLLLAPSPLVLGLLVRRLNARHPHTARRVLTWGMTVILVVAIWLFPDSWLPFLGLLVIFMSALLAPGSEIVTAAAIAGVTIWLANSEAREYQTLAICASLGVGLVLAWLSTDTLYTVLQWALRMQQQTDKLLVETQNQQAELKRTLKSLELATYLLERSNRELEIARRHADEARRMKEQFAANISHELRTPLNLILGFSEMMYLTPEVYGEVRWPPTLRRDVYHIYNSSVHLVGMIDDILDLSRFEMAQFTLSKELTDLGPLLHSAAEIAGGLLRGRPISLDVVVEPNLPQLDVDQTRIRQVVLNLLTNAQRFTTQGAIRIRAGRVESEVIVTVSDTGCGIPADKLPRVFEEFYQVDGSLRRSHDGAGLGLAVCKHFVEAHEGRIWVESQVGAGSAFHFSLPIPNVQTPISYPHVVSPLKTPEDHPCVLVVDPDPSVATIISRHVEGVTVVQVDDESRLGDTIALEGARAVLCNVPPTEMYEQAPIAKRDIAVPVIQCSLPSQAWIAQDLAVTACLTKPIMAARLRGEIARLGPICDILIVDDDHGFGQLVERVLDAGGGRDDDQTPPLCIRHAYDGVQGLQAMRDQRPDLVLLDLAMPVMDGFQVLAKMRQDPQLTSIPVILLTVTTYAEDALRRFGGRFVVECKDGLSPLETLRCLKGVLGALEPRYGSYDPNLVKCAEEVITPDRLH